MITNKVSSHRMNNGFVKSCWKITFSMIALKSMKSTF